MAPRKTETEGTMRMLLNDIYNRVGGTVLLIGAVVMFLAGAIAGLSLISRLGGAGWIMYGVVIGSWALVFGPVVAQAMTMHQNGSPRHREELRKRQEAQRLKFGLPAKPDSPTEEREDPRGSRRR